MKLSYFTLGSDARPARGLARRTPYGFTLTEMVILFAIMAVLTSIALPIASRISEGNHSVNCQANLHGLYEAIKMYRLDEDGYPPYDPGAATEEGKGLGLWALHVYGKRETAGILLSSPTARYVRGPRQMHCPDHRERKNYDPDLTDSNIIDPNRWTNPNSSAYFNLPYLSYQFSVPFSMDPWLTYSDAASTDAQFTYVSTRTTTATHPDFKRQLIPKDGTGPVVTKYPSEDTVITWCPHHRPYNRGKTDNVLFLDGSVEVLPVTQTCSSTTRVGWRRVHKHDCQ